MAGVLKLLQGADQGLSLPISHKTRTGFLNNNHTMLLDKVLKYRQEGFFMDSFSHIYRTIGKVYFLDFLSRLLLTLKYGAAWCSTGVMRGFLMLPDKSVTNHRGRSPILIWVEANPSRGGGAKLRALRASGSKTHQLKMGFWTSYRCGLPGYRQEKANESMAR